MSLLPALPRMLLALARCLRMAAALWLGLGLAAQAPAAPLELADARNSIDLWPAVRVLPDASRTLGVDQVLMRLAQFEAPDGPHANLGARRDAVWLHVPLQVPRSETGRWLLDIDYPSIDRIDVYVITDALPVHHVLLGRQLPMSQRPLATRAHTAPLALEPGQEHELLIRVETLSSMILPITLVKAEAFHAREARTQMLQGLLAGVGLCLLLYSLAHWVGLRDPLFGFYALSILGTTLFFSSYFGHGPQHLWPDNVWWTIKMPVLSVLLGLVGGNLFIERALGVGALSRSAAFALHAGALAAGGAALAFASGAIGYRAGHLIATVLGVLLMFVAVPVSYVHARRGDRIARYMLAGWGVYGMSALTMAALLRGLVGVDFRTQHAFQFGSLFEMAIWMRVLAIRIEELRRSAQRVHLERDAFHSLAHTDALTGLPNRRGLATALQAALPNCTAERSIAVYLLDLDGFKPINDRLGHDAGDELLVAVGKRLQAQLRSNDLVARLGGDEFVVMACGLPGDAEAQALGRKLLDSFGAPFAVAGQACSVGLTIGYALAPLDGRDAASLLKRADAAMYAGKQAGRQCLRRGAASAGLAGA